MDNTEDENDDNEEEEEEEGEEEEEEGEGEEEGGKEEEEEGGEKGEDEGGRLCRWMVYSFHTSARLQISIILDIVHTISLTKHHFCVLKCKRSNN